MHVCDWKKGIILKNLRKTKRKVKVEISSGASSEKWKAYYNKVEEKRKEGIASGKIKIEEKD